MSEYSYNTDDTPQEVLFTPSPPAVDGHDTHKRQKGRKVEQIDEGFGRMEGDTAMFEPDELFYMACKVKGVLDPFEEFKSKQLEDFIEKDNDFNRELAAQRLANYDMIRARKMTIVLKERERMIQAGVEPLTSGRHAPSQTSTRPSTVPSLRPPRIRVPPEQTDLFEKVRVKALITRKRALHNLRVKEFLAHRKQEEGKRQEAAYKEVKIRHLLSSVQRREIEKLNEQLFAERCKQIEADRKMRDEVKELWLKEQEGVIEGQRRKDETNEACRIRLQETRTQWLGERVQKRDAKFEYAHNQQATIAKVRVASLDAKSDRRKHIEDRKAQLDTERASSLKYKRVLQEAYSSQVVTRSLKMEAMRAQMLNNNYEEKTNKAYTVQEEGSRAAQWKVEAQTMANTSRRKKVQRFKTQHDTVQNARMRKKIDDKIMKIEKACGNKEKLLAMKSESVKLAGERRQAMAARSLNEQRVVQDKLVENIANKSECAKKRMQKLSQLFEALSHEPLVIE